MSVANDLENAVVAALQGLAAFAGVAVVARKSPTLPAGTNPPAAAVVVEAEGQSESLDAQHSLNTYPCAVVLFLAGGHKLAADPTTLALRQAVRQQLDDREQATFAGVAGFNRSTAGGRPPYDPAALAADLIASTQVFQLEVVEPRAT